MHNIYHLISCAIFQRSLKNEADTTNENDSNINYQINFKKGENLDTKIKNIANRWNLEYIKGYPPILRKGKQMKNMQGTENKFNEGTNIDSKLPC
ncbi:hypothetical protein CWI37_1890p0010 [Hamiltosporidium tvaerminnensis]|uniref:Uncharacterized protein n=1 Tax=Hamiltosporidium tvaerminnensis TaxID=1176355 RepID=A0A4Q9KU78_9MICR|nr:hypothetical protein CWI37_1890p0010 [Hamiltosporidium tvaerminnensis]